MEVHKHWKTLARDETASPCQIGKDLVDDPLERLAGLDIWVGPASRASSSAASSSLAQQECVRRRRRRRILCVGSRLLPWCPVQPPQHIQDCVVPQLSKLGGMI